MGFQIAGVDLTNSEVRSLTGAQGKMLVKGCILNMVIHRTTAAQLASTVGDQNFKAQRNRHGNIFVEKERTRTETGARNDDGKGSTVAAQVVKLTWFRSVVIGIFVSSCPKVAASESSKLT